MRPVIRLNYAVDAVKTYTQLEPLSSHLSRYFKHYKSIGSKDRKILRNLVYHYFRLGHCQQYFPVEKGVILSHFLCNKESDEFLDYWLPIETPFQEADVSKPVKHKFLMLAHQHSAISFESLFYPFIESLSPAVDKDRDAFLWSFLEQPKVYLYHFHNQPQQLIEDCQIHKIPVTRLRPNSFSVPPKTSLDELGTVKSGKIIVQDLSVQQSLSDIQFNDNATFWDCCAGSGGKSLLLKYFKPDCFIWATDKRKNILKNLEKRFQTFGIHNYQSRIFDLERSEPHFLKGKVDTVIMDAPCSGSGTWARTPENLFITTRDQIEQYQETQKQMAANVTKVLDKGSRIIYLTCSVFKEENENISDYMKEELGFELLETMYFSGYKHRAETIFRAILIKK